MADKPILFSAPMVRALLDGRKTQTRRVLKGVGDLDRCFQMDDGSWHQCDSRGGHMSPVNLRFAVGDRLWVRERFRGAAGYDHLKLSPKHWGNKPIWYDADGKPEGDRWGFLSDKSHPGIHMPRWASRLTLTVTAVRVQRLQEISEEDAKAEGCPGRLGPNPEFPDEWDPSPQEEYRDLWNTINGDGAWQANPWVVALTFTVERRNIDALAGRRAA